LILFSSLGRPPLRGPAYGFWYACWENPLLLKQGEKLFVADAFGVVAFDQFFSFEPWC
jgi:hypothetical protein